VKKKRTDRQKINMIIVGGLREAIRAHGPITKLLIGSAAKRITGTLLSRKYRSARHKKLATETQSRAWRNTNET